MKTPIGQSVRQWAGIFVVCEDYECSASVRDQLAKLYKDYNVYVVDLSSGERVKAVDLDPDLADWDKGYAVVVEAPGV
ncbi:MAG: hypothetical protein ACP5HQ_00350 [Thermoprotei archaeon]